MEVLQHGSRGYATWTGRLRNMDWEPLQLGPGAFAPWAGSLCSVDPGPGEWNGKLPGVDREASRCGPGVPRRQAWLRNMDRKPAGGFTADTLTNSLTLTPNWQLRPVPRKLDFYSMPLLSKWQLEREFSLRFATDVFGCLEIWEVIKC